MPKNIVLCFDGTNNRFGRRNTNVVHLYAVLDLHPDRQATYYDPGVGTFSARPALTAPSRFVLRMLGNAFGLGLTQNIEEGYRFLMQHWTRGDKIFLFGFSRGAYTARALAGLVYMTGLLPPGSENLVPYATGLFKRKEFDVAKGFKATFSRKAKVHFLGLWDTVSSVGWVWDRFSLPYTTNHPSVTHVRHAVAIDERRAFFQQNLFGEGRYTETKKQVWFPGVHSDVGGSYPDGEAGQARIALEWMLVEAVEQGLRIDSKRAIERVKNSPPLDGPEYRLHESLTPAWWVAEVWPKMTYSFRWKRRYPRMNLWRRRHIAQPTTVHASVLQRQRDDAGYRPSNLPPHDAVEPWRKLKTLLRERSSGGTRTFPSGDGE